MGLAAGEIWAAVAGLGLHLDMPWDGYYSLSLRPATLGGIVLTIWVAQKLEGVSGILSYLGRNVIAIYVMHILATAGTRIILRMVGVEVPIIHLAIGTAAGVIVPLLILKLLQRLRLARYEGLPEG